jgi:molybdopterin synthase catalytic subunit
VATLTLEHYPGMTESSIDSILERAEQRWPLLEIQVIHRVGTLAPTDQIVLVAVASGHRDAAFAAAEFVMDYLKTDAVFWKKEQTEAGTHWVQSTEQDHQRAREWAAEVRKEP